jgi:hypothetical protein
VIRNRALGLRVQEQPAVNSTEGLKTLECMLQMLTAVYGAIAELVSESELKICDWTSGFLEGMRYQLRRMLAVLVEYLKTSDTPKRFWVCASYKCSGSFRECFSLPEGRFFILILLYSGLSAAHKKDAEAEESATIFSTSDRRRTFLLSSPHRSWLACCIRGA